MYTDLNKFCAEMKDVLFSGQPLQTATSSDTTQYPYLCQGIGPIMEQWPSS